MNSFDINSAFSSDDVITRLRVLAAEWRESMQPAAVRTLPALRLKVQLDQRSFRLSVIGLAPRRLFTFRGRLTAVCVGEIHSTASGCRIEAHYEPSRLDSLGFAIRVVPFVGLALWMRTAAAWGFAALLTIVFAGEFGLYWASSTEQRAALREVLVDVATAAPAAAPVQFLSPAP